VPEGDTIHALARRLRGALVPGTVEHLAARSPGPRPGAGTSIDEVGARGKHLLVSFGDDLTLHLHLGMEGSVRLTTPDRAPAVRAGPPHRGVVAVLVTDRAAAVGRGLAVAEVLDPPALRRHPVLARLGPDLCDPDPDLDEVLRRLAAAPGDTPVGVALLDQRVAAGIGNVYRSEVLWAERVAPDRPLARLDDERRRALYATAHRLLRANLGDRPRRTVPTGLAVYERAGRRCPRCSGTITSTRLGEQARSVWWCPACQTPA